jgi:hypothetical protein
MPAMARGNDRGAGRQSQPRRSEMSIKRATRLRWRRTWKSRALVAGVGVAAVAGGVHAASTSAPGSTTASHSNTVRIQSSDDDATESTSSPYLEPDDGAQAAQTNAPSNSAQSNSSGNSSNNSSGSSQTQSSTRAS